VNIQLHLDIATENIQLQLDNMTMDIQLQLDNFPQNLQLQLDDSTRIFHLQLEILTTESFPKLTRILTNHVWVHATLNREHGCQDSFYTLQRLYTFPVSSVFITHQ
jgi:hypothetical protein